MSVTLMEIQVGRRAFAVSQQTFAGAATGASDLLATGWYDTGLHPETGAFALVPADGSQDALIGEIISVSFAQRTVFAYVLQGASLPDGMQIGLARRAFAGLARLSLEVIDAEVVTIQ